MPAEHHIPVSEETRAELEKLKEPGETYDHLLRVLANHKRREELEHHFERLEDADSKGLMSVEDV